MILDDSEIDLMATIIGKNLENVETTTEPEALPKNAAQGKNKKADKC